MHTLKKRSALIGLSVSLFVASLAIGASLMAEAMLAWSETRYGQGVHAWHVETAANSTEGGYTDWRLPTPEEFTDAVNSQSVLFPPGNASYWTSRRQGGAYAYAAKFRVGEDGLPDPSTLQILRYRSNAILYAYYVRP